jgi:nitroreductase
VREFTSQPADEKTIRRLIDAAVLAPNAVNKQPWTFTVVRDQALLDQISRAAKSQMLATMPADAHWNHFNPMLNDPNFHIFHNAPALILIAARSPGPWIVEDCALAAQNFMLAAYAAGLGSCWIGFAQSFLNSPEGKRIAGLAAACVPVAPIIVGRAKSAASSVERKTPDIRWIG